MRKVLFVCAYSLMSSATYAYTFTTSVNQLASNIGSKVSINISSDKGSVMSGNYTQIFSFNNGLTDAIKNVNVNGNTPTNITTQFNSNIFVFKNW